MNNKNSATKILFKSECVCRIGKHECNYDDVNMNSSTQQEQISGFDIAKNMTAALAKVYFIRGVICCCGCHPVDLH